MASRPPDPELVRAFGRAVRAHFEEEVEKRAGKQRNDARPSCPGYARPCSAHGPKGSVAARGSSARMLGAWGALVSPARHGGVNATLGSINNCPRNAPKR
jgi:hypothetical protein